MASDSWVTHSSEAGGSRRGTGQKLFRKRISEGRKTYDVIIGTAGESSPALLFVDWYGSGQDQTVFMRNKVKQEAHVGGSLVELEQDPETGAILAMTPKLIRYFVRGYYNNRWNRARAATKPVRST